MASAQSLGTLTIDLGLKTAQLQSDAGKAARITEQTMDKIQKSAAATGQAIGLALAGGFAIVEESVRRSLDQMDEFSKAAQKVGVSTEEFSKLAYAAKLSDVSVDDLTTTLAKLSKNQVEAAKGTAAQEQAFNALGIAFKNADGSLRAPNQVLNDLADLFQALPDGAGKTAIAIGLLGKSGANAIPLLNGGSAALKELGDEAERFGVVIDGPTGRAAEEFNDNLTRLGTQAQGFATQLTANLLPDLLALEGRLMDVSGQADAVSNVADAVRAIGDAAKLAVNSVQALTNGILATYNVAKAGAELTGPGFFKNLVTGQLGDKFDEIKTGLSSAKAGLDDVNKSAKSTLDTFGQGSGRTAAGIADLFEASIPKAQAKNPISDTDALKRQQAFIDASRNAAAASKAQSSADAATRKAQAEQEALQKRIAAGTQEMANAIAQSSENLLKTGIPAVDDYNESLLKISESAAKFTKDGLPAAEVSTFSAKMTELAAATRDASLAQEQIASHNATLDLAAQAKDATDAASGIVGLASANRDYEKSLEALDKQFESLAITPEDYKSQLDSLDVLHKKTIADLQKTSDQAGQFALEAAKGIQGAIYDALAGDGLKGGVKGFLDGIGDMLKKAAAQIVAADLAKQLFGDFDKTGKVGGLAGNLFGGSGSAGASGGSGAGWLDKAAGWFGSLFGGARANGGPVAAGQGYLVGEHGPEFFAPSTSGTIVSNQSMRSGGGARGLTLNTTYLVQGRIDMRTQSQLAQSAGREASRALARNG
jgi:hypothetical protein